MQAHRDLKPNKITLCNSSQSQAAECKIIDFGIARIELSPEQAAKTITRTDGCIMFDCVSGHPPFIADEAILMIEISLEYGKCFTNKKYRYTPAAAQSQLEFSEFLLNEWVKSPAQKAQLESSINELRTMIRS